MNLQAGQVHPSLRLSRELQVARGWGLQAGLLEALAVLEGHEALAAPEKKIKYISIKILKHEEDRLLQPERMCDYNLMLVIIQSELTYP